MLNAAAPSRSANRNLLRAAAAAKAVLTDLGRIERHRHEIEPGAFDVAASA
jgi:hypothetical protein